MANAEAPPTTVPLPESVIQTLLRFGLRTEPGRACWDGFISTQLADHPWLAARDAAGQPVVEFRVGWGEVARRRPAAPVPNGLAAGPPVRGGAP